MRVATATPHCTVSDCGENTARILALVHEAHQAGAELVVFPELCITGYTCQDLFTQDLLARVSLSAVRLIAEKTRDIPVCSVIGFPFEWKNARYNCAAVIRGGKVRGVVPKSHIPNYGEFYEVRHFEKAPTAVQIIPPGVFGAEGVPFGTDILFCDDKQSDISFAVEICEDLWVPSPPSSRHAAAGALVIANLSASNEIIGKSDYRRVLVSSQSGRTACAYLYADAGTGESTTDLVFSGHNLIAENGSIISESSLFEEGLLVADIDIRKLVHERRRMNTFPSSAGETYARVTLPLLGSAQQDKLQRTIDPHPFVPSAEGEREKRCEEVFAIQTTALVKRLAHTGSTGAVIGLSGGLDSTLALLATVRAFDLSGKPRNAIQCITMPGFGTTGRTKTNALKLAELLGTSVEEIRIHKAVLQHFRDIGQDVQNTDITYENSQARERTQILMDKANMTNSLVIGTGDLSELALGWATYNGDHMSMYAVNTSIPKTLVRHLVAYCAHRSDLFLHDANELSDDRKIRSKLRRVLESILDTPVSPELLPPTNGTISQKTEHIVGPYELHDFFLYHCLRWGSSPARIYFLACQAFKAGQEGQSFSKKEILQWMKVFYRRFFSQQFKRSCLPDGPKVGTVTLSPRGDWRMPSDASAAVWMKEVETLEEAEEGSTETVW